MLPVTRSSVCPVEFGSQWTTPKESEGRFRLCAVGVGWVVISAGKLPSYHAFSLFFALSAPIGRGAILLTRAALTAANKKLYRDLIVSRLSDQGGKRAGGRRPTVRNLKNHDTRNFRL